MIGSDSRVWITGASRGLGRGLAVACAKKQAHLILSGRSVPLLEQVAQQCRVLGAQVELLPFDIHDAQQTEAALTSLQDIPTVVINNAGISQRALAADTSFATTERLTRINYLAPVQITRYLLPHYLKRGQGTVVGVSSIAAVAGIPLRSSYCAAKSALLRFYQTLMAETRKSGVHVCVVLPGFIRTEMSQQALTGEGQPYGKIDADQAHGMDPLKAGEYIAGHLSRSVVWVGLPFRLYVLRLLAAIAPGLLVPLLAGRS